jgi:hypothetical protein
MKLKINQTVRVHLTQTGLDRLTEDYAKPANEATWQCPKCKRWQSHERGICLSEYDTGIPCDGKQPHPAAPADAGDAMSAFRIAALYHIGHSADRIAVLTGASRSTIYKIIGYAKEAGLI